MDPSKYVSGLSGPGATGLGPPPSNILLIVYSDMREVTTSRLYAYSGRALRHTPTYYMSYVKQYKLVLLCYAPVLHSSYSAMHTWRSTARNLQT